jgi:hypothetical protein
MNKLENMTETDRKALFDAMLEQLKKTKSCNSDYSSLKRSHSAISISEDETEVIRIKIVNYYLHIDIINF